MDGKQSIPRPTGIPRLSKLPVPKSNTLRSNQSRESLTNQSELRNSRLRNVASKDQLSTPQPARKSEYGTASGQSTLRASRSRQSLNYGAGISPRTTTPKATTKFGLAREVSSGLDDIEQRDVGQFNFPSGPIQGSRANGDSLTSSEPISDGGLSEDAAPIGTSKAPHSRSRLSLAERTIETLSQIPSSPAMTGKTSNFYDPDSARKPRSRPGSSGSRPGSRPGSSHQPDAANRPTSRHSRPSSSSGQDDGTNGFQSSASKYKTKLGTIDGTPSRAVTGSAIKSLRTPSTRSSPAPTTRSGGKVLARTVKGPTPSRSPSPEKAAQPPPSTRYGAKTMAARTPKPRASLNGLFKKPSMPALDKSSQGSSRKASLTSHRSSNASAAETLPSTASTTSTAPTLDSPESPPAMSSRKSSAALREQIAKAKAARRAASRQVSSPTAVGVVEEAPVIPTDTTFDFGLSADPFNQQSDEKSRTKMLLGRIEAARTSGRLNIAALGLKEIPAEVLKMYDLESIGAPDGAWAESVDLTRFVAADNELEMIEEAVFPDVDPEEFESDPDSRGSIFGALETLDLHGNMLICMPTGLRRLPLLTSLNLSGNRLANNCLEVISQISSLRDLKLGGNLLYGPLDPCLSRLPNLEILDLHGNNISSLPVNFDQLARLRILNVSENNLEILPFAVLANLPLNELLARKNLLSGTLIEDTVACLAHIQILDVTSNQLAELVPMGKTVQMPKLHQLSLSMNRLQGLPDIGDWTSLVTLTADENSISAVPDGMTGLEKLRHVDFSSNDIRVVPPEIGRMENLAVFRLSGNPLRDKKFSNIDTDELKAILAARLEPLPVHVEPDQAAESQPVIAEPAMLPEDDAAFKAPTTADDQDQDSRSDMDDFATPPTSAPASPNRSRAQTLNGQTWPVKPGGILDRSNTESSSLHPVVCSKIAATETVREIHLQHNLFTVLPESLSFFVETLTILSLSHNQLVGETYIGSENLALPALKELNLASNHITGLVSLTSHLQSPNLQKLDVSFNRISTMPPGCSLKAVFPSLAVLLISNNHLDELDPEAIKGLRIVDAANNDIAHLNPRLGLLGGSGGLERLEVMGNRFRVPRWNVLERGTEATLRWLRSRVPVAEMAAWKDGDEEGEGWSGVDTSLADVD